MVHGRQRAFGRTGHAEADRDQGDHDQYRRRDFAERRNGESKGTQQQGENEGEGE